jgi:murein DD-endopeptidase MepM/ murein hydrolase activator NlpD
MRSRITSIAVASVLVLGLDSSATTDDPWAAETARLAAAAAAALPKPQGPPAAAVPATARLEPFLWAPGEGEQCRTYNGRSFCDGPRRVPAPWGKPLALAEELGIVERRAGRMALYEPMPAEWAAAVEGEAPEELLWPVPDGQLTRRFGNLRELIRRDGRVTRGPRRIPHPGVDISAAVGDPIVAAADGMVVYSNNDMRGYGNALVLLHADGSTTLYAHCEATYAFRGQQVRRGQILGEVGQTGLAHNPHLHFEWRRDGEPLDPEDIFVEIPPRRESEGDEPTSVEDGPASDPAAEHEAEPAA